MNATARNTDTPEKRAMMALLGDENVRYYPIFAKHFGGACAGLLLSQLTYWHGKQADPDGWIRKTVAELEIETGLTEREQETARALLKNAGIVDYKRRGMPARPYYRILWDTFLEQLGNAPSVRAKRSNKKGQNAPICEDVSSGVLLEQNVLTNSETTSKTTTQTTSKKIAATAAPLESSPQIQTQPEPEGEHTNGTSSPLQHSPIDDDVPPAPPQNTPASTPRPRNIMFDKLAAMTHTTGAMAGPQIGKLIKQLKASHYDETHLDLFEAWWCQDWRSKSHTRGDIVPTVGQIGQLFGVAMAWAEKHAPKPAPIVEQLSPEDAAALEAKLMAEYEAQEAERTRRRIAAGYIKA